MKYQISASYRGQPWKQTWAVYHPGMSPDTVYVAAPNPVAAVVAAADAWRTRWTAVEFHSHAVVRPL